MLEGRTIRDGYMVGTWRKLCLPFPTKLYFSSMRKSETGDVVTEQRDRVWLKKNVSRTVLVCKDTSFSEIALCCVQFLWKIALK